MKKLLLVLAFLGIALSSFSQNLQISGGNNYSLTICSNTNVYAWGSNASGQVLGNGTSAGIISTPTLVTGLPSNIRQVDAGSGSHAVSVDCNGRVWTWGLDNCGQTGRGGAVVAGNACESGSSWKTVGTVPGIGIGETYGPASKVSGGNNTTYVILTVTGEVLAWGQNDQGQLADGGTTNRSTPDYVYSSAGVRLSNITSIEGGDNTSYALDKNGYVWSWGANSTGNREAGRTPSGTNLLYAGLVQADYDNDGTADGPLQNIIILSGGDTHGIAIDNQGRVWGWGGNWAQGQLGNGSNYNNSDFAKLVNAPGNSASTVDRGVSPFIGSPASVPGAVFAAAGQASSAVVLSNGRVVTFGSNKKYGGTGCNYGTLGNGDNTSAGQSLYPQYVKLNATTTLTGIVSVSDGDGWYFAQDASGQYYAWGENAGGTLGDGTTTCSEYAKPITLPSGCTGYLPCPSAPNIGSDQTACPNFTFSTNQLASTYVYTWQTRPTTVSGWSLISSGTGISFSTASGTSIGQYRLLINDNRGSVSVLCGNCPTVGDTVTFSAPYCSTTPNLGSDLQVCQPVNQVLNSGLSGNNLIFKWEYSASSSTAGFVVQSTGAGLNTYTASGLGFYRVSVINNTTCSGCIPSGTDVIQLTTAPSVFIGAASSLCSTIAGSGVFSITTSAGGGSYFWFTNPSGGSALNTTAGLSISGISSAQTSTLAGCSGRVLYVEDQSSVQGVLNPISAGQQTTMCPSNPSGKDNGHRLQIYPTRNISLTSVDVWLPQETYGQTFNLTFNVYPINLQYCGGACGANIWPQRSNTASQTFASSTSIPAFGTNTGSSQYTVTLSGINLTANTLYWIEVSGAQIRQYTNCNFNTASAPACASISPCNWSGPLWDNSGNNILGIYGSEHNGSYNTKDNAMFNIKYSAGNVSACTRVPVCATLTCPALNVSYYEITAEKTNGGALVKWTTISEENSSHFIVERSGDGIVFEAIGKVSSKGNSNGWVDYSFLDKKPGKGTVYYRLVQYDFDNSYYLSKVVSINMTTLTDFNVIPNPNNGYFTINANLTSTSNYTIQITNSLGASIFTTSGNSTGYYSKEFDFSSLASGVYFVSLKAGDDYIVKKVLIE